MTNLCSFIQSSLERPFSELFFFDALIPRCGIDTNQLFLTFSSKILINTVMQYTGEYK